MRTSARLTGVGVSVRSGLLVIVCLVSLVPLAFSQDVPATSTFKDEPAAHKLYDQMIDAFHRAESLSFVSKFERGTVGKESSSCIYRAWLKKPNFFRLESQLASGDVGGVLVGDGESQWIYWPKGRPRWELLQESAEDEKTRFNSYITKPALPRRHSIWHEALYLGGGMSFPVYELSTFHGYVDPILEELDGVRSTGTELIGGKECDQIHVSFLDGQRNLYLWLSRNDRLPRKLKEIVKVNEDRFAVEEWSSVTINAPIADEMFEWQPPVDWVQWRLPDAEDSLLKPGTKAPDFELASADGKRIKLSDFKGKTVWLCFWRLGCPPCRKETPLLKKLYDAHKDKGLVVLGVNVADDRQLVLEYFRKQGVTFPNIIDTSEEASDVCHEDYGGGGVPLNYLIDREGNVVDAAFGYEAIRGSLAKLRPELGNDAR